MVLISVIVLYFKMLVFTFYSLNLLFEIIFHFFHVSMLYYTTRNTVYRNCILIYQCISMFAFIHVSRDTEDIDTYLFTWWSKRSRLSKISLYKAEANNYFTQINTKYTSSDNPRETTLPTTFSILLNIKLNIKRNYEFTH